MGCFLLMSRRKNEKECLDAFTDITVGSGPTDFLPPDTSTNSRALELEGI